MNPLDALDPEIAAVLESRAIGEIRADTPKEYRIGVGYVTRQRRHGRRVIC